MWLPGETAAPSILKTLTVTARTREDQSLPSALIAWLILECGEQGLCSINVGCSYLCLPRVPAIHSLTFYFRLSSLSLRSHVIAGDGVFSECAHWRRCSQALQSPTHSVCVPMDCSISQRYERWELLESGLWGQTFATLRLLWVPASWGKVCIGH